MPRCISALLLALVFVCLPLGARAQNFVTLFLQPAVVQESSTAVTGFGATVSATFGSTPTPGTDLMMCSLSYISGLGLETPPSGWSLYDRAYGTGIVIAAYYRVVQAGDGAGPYAFGLGFATAMQLGCTEYTNIDPVAPFGPETLPARGALGGAGTVSAGSVTTSAPGELPILLTASTAAVTASQSGWTNDWDSHSTSGIAISGHAQHYASVISNRFSFTAATTYAGPAGNFVLLLVTLRAKFPPSTIAGAATTATSSAPAYASTMAYVGHQFGSDPGVVGAQQHLTVARYDLGSSGIPPGAAQIDCFRGGSCVPMEYVDFASLYCDKADTRALYAAATNGAGEPWLLHTSYPHTSANRVSTVGSGGVCPNGTGNIAYYPDPGNSQLQNFWRGLLAPRLAWPNEAIFLDDLRWYCSLGLIDEYGCPASGTPITAVAKMRAAQRLAIASLAPNKVICNCLGPGGGFFANGTGTTTTSSGGSFQYSVDISFFDLSNLIGGTFEGIFRNYTGHTGYGVINWRIVANTCSQILAYSSASCVFLDYPFHNGVDGADGSTDDQLRRLHTAAVWLMAGNSMQRIMSWLASYNTPSSDFIAVTPEQQIWVRNPLTPLRPYVYNAAHVATPEVPIGNGTGCRYTSSGHAQVPDTYDSGGVDDLAVYCGIDSSFNPAAVYAREYADCYYAGTRFGPCAAIINATSSAVTIPANGTTSSWFSQTYAHSIGWTGGALAGLCATYCTGAINLTASPVVLGATAIAPGDAMLLAP